MIYRYSLLVFALAVLLFSCGSKKDEVDPEKDDKKEAVDSATKGSFAFPEIDPQPRFYSGITKVAFSSQNMTDIKVKIDGKEVANFPESGTHEYEFDTRELEDGEVEFIYIGKQEDGEEVSIKKSHQIKNHLITINLMGQGQSKELNSDNIITDFIQIHNNEGEILEAISLEDKADEKIEIERPLGLGDEAYFLTNITVSGNNSHPRLEVISFNYKDEEEFTLDNTQTRNDQNGVNEIIRDVMFRNKPEGNFRIHYKVKDEEVRSLFYSRGDNSAASEFEFDLRYNNGVNFDPANDKIKFLFSLTTNEHIIFRELDLKIDQPIDLTRILVKDGLKKHTVKRPALVTTDGASLYIPFTWYGGEVSFLMERMDFNDSNEINIYGDESILTNFSSILTYNNGIDSYTSTRANNFGEHTLERLIEYNKDTKEVNVIFKTELTTLVFNVFNEASGSDFSYRYATIYYRSLTGKIKLKRLPISQELKEKYELTTIEDVEPLQITPEAGVVKDQNGNVITFEQLPQMRDKIIPSGSLYYTHSIN